MLTAAATMQVGSASVRPVAVLNPPHQHFVSRGLPTADFPSDHVSVVCDFQIVCQPSFSEQSMQHD
jgi:hypothetical protein